MPDTLKNVFLGPDETLFTIISSQLSPNQENQLVSKLSRHKGSIGWSIPI